MQKPMMSFYAEAIITPRAGVLDTQGKAVEKTLGRLGYENAGNVRVGRIVTMTVKANEKSEAAEYVKSMCGDLLANDLIETYTVTVREAE